MYPESYLEREKLLSNVDTGTKRYLKYEKCIDFTDGYILNKIFMRVQHI